MSASTGVNMRVPTLKCLAADVIAGLVSGKEMVRLFEDLPDEPADIVLARYTTSTLRGAQGSASGVHHTPVARLLDFEAAQAACTLPEGVISRYTQRRSNALWEQVVRSDEESLSSAAARASSSNSYCGDFGGGHDESTESDDSSGHCMRHTNTVSASACPCFVPPRSDYRRRCCMQMLQQQQRLWQLCSPSRGRLLGLTLCAAGTLHLRRRVMTTKIGHDFDAHCNRIRADGTALLRLAESPGMCTAACPRGGVGCVSIDLFGGGGMHTGVNPLEACAWCRHRYVQAETSNSNRADRATGDNKAAGTARTPGRYRRRHCTCLCPSLARVVGALCNPSCECVYGDTDELQVLLHGRASTTLLALLCRGLAQLTRSCPPSSALGDRRRPIALTLANLTVLDRLRGANASDDHHRPSPQDCVCDFLFGGRDGMLAALLRLSRMSPSAMYFVTTLNVSHIDFRPLARERRLASSIESRAVSISAIEAERRIGVDALFCAAAQARCLRHLRVVDCGVNACALTRLLPPEPSHSSVISTTAPSLIEQLHVLDISENPLGAQGSEVLMQALGKARQLKVLAVAHCDLVCESSRLGAERLLSAIGTQTGCYNIRKLVLRDNPLSEDALPALIDILQHAKSLTSLDLSGTRITGNEHEQPWLRFSDALVAAMHGEGRMPLEELDMSRNRLFDRRVALLLHRMAGRHVPPVPPCSAPESNIGLPSAPALRCFRLAGNRLTVRSLQSLAEALRIQDLAETEVSPEAADNNTADNNENMDNEANTGVTTGCTVAAHLGRRAFVLDLRDNPLGLASDSSGVSCGNFVAQLRHFFNVHKVPCKLLVDVSALWAPEGFDCGPGVAAMARERSLAHMQPAKRRRMS